MRRSYLIFPAIVLIILTVFSIRQQVTVYVSSQFSQTPESLVAQQNSIFREVDWTQHASHSKMHQAKQPGYTMMDNLYLWRGSLYIVTEDPAPFPQARMVTSKGTKIDQSQASEPTDELIVINSTVAASLLGQSVQIQEGVTFINTDHKQFLQHMFHFVAEVVMEGMWRTYTSLDPEIPSSGQTSLEMPRRFIFVYVEDNDWRDYPRINSYFLNTAFPGISVETQQDWLDRKLSARPFHFERVVLGDRIARHRQPSDRRIDYRFPFDLSKYFWEPVRQNVVRASCTSSQRLPGIRSSKPLVAYISRQGTGRRLTSESHDALVQHLQNRSEIDNYEFLPIAMETMSLGEQICLASQATIILGVHGNGLSQALWVPRTPQAAVIEIVVEGGYAVDYEFLTRSLGIQYYLAWPSRAWATPDLPQALKSPAGFHGPAITCNPTLIGEAIRGQLSRTHFP